MSRIKDWHKNELSEEQLKVYKEIINGPRGEVIGPLKIWINNPKFASCAQKVGKYVRYESNLETSLSELAIITTARCWSSEFEWEHHAPLAEQAGINVNHINQISEGKRPLFKSDKEQIVFDFSAEANINKNVSDKLYTTAITILNKRSLIDIVAICGYYSLISMTLNIFKVPKKSTKWNLAKINNLNQMLA